MTSHEPNPTPAWMTEAAALRRLALGVVGERCLAEDTLQEAYLAWLDGGEPDLSSPRAWFAEVCRRLGAGKRREEQNRGHRERAAARPEAVDTSTTGERLEVARRLLEELEQLRPEWREILILRFFDDLAPRHVAARLNLPVNTVRSRTRRALEEMRQRLGDDEQAYLGGWALPFAGSILSPLSKAGTSGGGWKGIGIGALFMKPATALVPLCLILIGLPFLLSDPEQQEQLPDQRAAVFTESDRSEVALGTGQGELAPQATATSTSQETPAPPLAREAREELTGQGMWTLKGQLYTRPFAQPEFPLERRVRLTLTVLAGYEGEEVLATTSLQSDARGQFQWSAPRPEGTVRLRLEHRDKRYRGAAETRLVPFSAEPPGDLGLWLQPLDTRVHGRVLDAQGEPIGGVTVRAGLAKPGDPTHCISDEQGAYTLMLSSLDGTGFFVASRAGYRAETVRLTLVDGPGEYVHNVVLEPGYVLRGRVLDPYGNPVAGAEVSTGFTSARDVSDAEGRYELNTLDGSSSTWMLEARHPDWVRYRDYYQPTGPEAIFDFYLGLGTTVSGRVVGPQGEGLPGVSVRIAATMIHADKFETFTRDDGTFDLHGAPLGAQTLWVHQPGMVTAERALRLGEEGESGILVQLDPGHSISGRVVDEDGHPVPNAPVYGSLSSWHASSKSRTDQDGRFELKGLPAGEVEVSVSAPRKLYEVVKADSTSTTPLEIRVGPAAGLEGRVVDDVTGEPIENFVVQLGGGDLGPGEVPTGPRDASWLEGRPFSSKLGRWVVPHPQLIPGGLASVVIRSPGYAARRIPRAVATVHPEDNLVIARMTLGQSLRGTVVDALTGDPIQGATVQRFTPWRALRWADEEIRKPVTTDSAGRFHMTAVPPGEFCLAVSHPDWTSTALRGLEMPERESLNDVVLSMFTGASLTGRVHDPELGPESNVELELRAKKVEADGTTTRTAHSGTDGYFQFDGLAAGTYELVRFRQDGTFKLETERRRIELGEREELELRWRYSKTTCIDGRLRSALPLPDACLVQLRLLSEPKRPADPRGWQAVARDGRFDFCQLPAGTFEVRIRHRPQGSQEFLTATATVELKRGDTEVVWLELVPGMQTR